MPLVTIRNATGPSEDAASGIRRPLLPAGQRAEAIQKILDALGRHLSGEAVLSRDALVELIEDFSRLLKSSALPQENGRAVARRLIAFIESLPVPERLAIERELGGRGPAPRTAIRNLPLQMPVSAQIFSAQAAPSADVALLQATLRKTFGAEEAATQVDQTIKDGPESEPATKTRTDASRTSDAGDGRPRAPAGARDPATPEIAPNPAEGGTAEAEAAQQTLPKAHESAPRAEAAKAGPSPAAPGGETFRAVATTEATSKKADRTSGEIGTEEGADGWDSDGTYGLPRAKAASDRQQARPAAARREAASLPARALADIVKSLASDGLTPPERAAESGRPTVPKEASLPTPPDPASPDQARNAALRARDAASGAHPSTDPAAAEPVDSPAPGSTPVIQQRTRQAGEDPAIQQAIALLVESGLPKEVIPFALVPYPAQEDMENDSDDKERQPREDGEDGAEAGLENGEGKKEQHSQSDGDAPAEPEAADAYDLYRKLGDLG